MYWLQCFFLGNIFQNCNCSQWFYIKVLYKNTLSNGSFHSPIDASQLSSLLRKPDAFEYIFECIYCSGCLIFFWWKEWKSHTELREPFWIYSHRNCQVEAGRICPLSTALLVLGNLLGHLLSEIGHRLIFHFLRYEGESVSYLAVDLSAVPQRESGYTGTGTCCWKSKDRKPSFSNRQTIFKVLY